MLEQHNGTKCLFTENEQHLLLVRTTFLLHNFPVSLQVRKRASYLRLSQGAMVFFFASFSGLP